MHRNKHGPKRAERPTWPQLHSILARNVSLLVPPKPKGHSAAAPTPTKRHRHLIRFENAFSACYCSVSLFLTPSGGSSSSPPSSVGGIGARPRPAAACISVSSAAKPRASRALPVAQQPSARWRCRLRVVSELANGPNHAARIGTVL
jgi:hypothetical protein